MLYPASLKWESDSVLLIESLGKPGMRENDLLIYHPWPTLANGKILTSGEHVKLGVFENVRGRVRNIELMPDEVTERFTKAGLIEARDGVCR